MSENNQGPPPVPNNKPKGTTNESKIPPPLPKAKITASTPPQDETSTAKNDISAGTNLPPKLPGKESNTPPPLPTTMEQNETGSGIIDDASAKKIPPELPNRKSKTPPPLAPSMRQNARQTKSLPNSVISNSATNQTGNNGKRKLFLFSIGIVAALIAIISISNSGGNDIPLNINTETEENLSNEESTQTDISEESPQEQTSPIVTIKQCLNCRGTGTIDVDCYSCQYNSNCQLEKHGGYERFSRENLVHVNDGTLFGFDKYVTSYSCSVCSSCGGRGIRSLDCSACNGKGTINEITQ